MEYKVERIPKHYVKDDYAQVRLCYKIRLVLFDINKVLFLGDLKLEQPQVNAYMDDIRKNGLPYSNIPTYKEESITSISYCTHQLLEFNKPYISFVDGEFKLSYVLKDEDGTALLVSQNLRFPNGYTLASKQELQSRIKETLKTKEEPYLVIDGISEQIHFDFGISLDAILDDLCEYISAHADKLPLYFETGQITYDESNGIEIENMIYRVIGPIFFVRTDGSTIFIKKFQLRRTHKDYYDFEFSDIEGIKMLSLEEIKNSKISLMPNPNINLIFNPEYKVEDLEQAKTLIKTSEE